MLAFLVFWQKLRIKFSIEDTVVTNNNNKKIPKDSEDIQKKQQ